MRLGGRITFALVTILVPALLLSACKQQDAPSTDTGNWLRGDARENFEAVEEQFGGFSVTMWEMGYRYMELYWAGLDENWEYAEHQLEEMEEAMRRGIIRRPEHAEAARTFLLEHALPRMHAVVENGDVHEFREEGAVLTQSCNACHTARDHAFIRIAPPVLRMTPVRLGE
jgi:hypothetical protein